MTRDEAQEIVYAAAAAHASHLYWNGESRYDLAESQEIDKALAVLDDE